jgi:alpha-1,6-mannosyltransferase
MALHWRYRHRHAFSPLWRRFLASDPVLTVDSDFSRTALQSETGGRTLTKVHTVPLGFDLARFPSIGREEARRSFSVQPNEILLTGVGRLEAIKRPDWIINAIEAIGPQHQNVRLILAGDGPERARLQAVVAHLGGRIKLPGILPADRLPALLEASDLFLNADHGSPAFGLSNAEALVMGTPVLATDSGAHREVVDINSGDGTLIPMDDESGWAKELSRWCERLPEPPEQRANRVARSAVRFQRSAMVDQYLEVYRKIDA